MKLHPVSVAARRAHPDAARRFVRDASRGAVEEQPATAASPRKIASHREPMTVNSVARGNCRERESWRCWAPSRSDDRPVSTQRRTRPYDRAERDISPYLARLARPARARRRPLGLIGALRRISGRRLVASGTASAHYGTLACTLARPRAKPLAPWSVPPPKPSPPLSGVGPFCLLLTN